MGGLALMVSGLGILASAIVEVIDGGADSVPLAWSAGAVGVPGYVLWRMTSPPQRMGNVSVYSAVFASWGFISLAGTLPYLVTGTIPSFHNALVESISGFTTTGATVLRPIEAAGAGVLFWRATTQWFGGMGVIVLAVAVLPYLGVGGLGLMQAEAPGPQSARLVPRVRETAQRLWTLYVAFTLIVAAAYALAGMTPYDAVVHSFTTVSTGGFSPYSDSIAHFSSPAVEWIAIVSMFAAGVSFALYWRALRGKPLLLIRSAEAAAYAAIVGSFALLASAWNAARDGWTHDTVRESVFGVVSLSTTTGYTTVDYTVWPAAVLLTLLFAMALGGMTGSTAGGFKVFRLLVVLGYGRRQAILQLHPRIVRVVRLGHEVTPDEVVNRVVGFFALFMATGAAATLLVAAFGSDIVTSISAAASAIGNVGPGLGDVGPGRDLLDVTAPSRVVLAFVMLVGRLEVFPVLLGVVPLLRFVGDRLPRRAGRAFVRVLRG